GHRATNSALPPSPQGERMKPNRRSRRLARPGVALILFLLASGLLATAVVVADTGNTNTIKVSPATTTISPPATGGTITINLVGNGAVDIGGAGVGLQFDKSKLQVTSITKDATEVANGVAYAGFPSAANMATFIANANTNGSIPVIAWSYTDGVSFEP